MLDKKCKGDSALLIGAINTGLHNPAYTRALLRGPEQVKKRWHALFTEYTAVQSRH